MGNVRKGSALKKFSGQIEADFGQKYYFTQAKSGPDKMSLTFLNNSSNTTFDQKLRTTQLDL
jgi:hypothetical protein